MMTVEKTKKMIRRSLEEIRATVKIARVISVSGALSTFIAKIDIQRCVRNGYKESPNVKRHLLRKHEVMLEYFDKTFAEYTKHYDFNKMIDDDEKLRNQIWICWWQGLEQAPDIVKICIESIKRNIRNYNITLISDTNYKEYVHIPEWVEKKRRKGIISNTHFADLLRVSLLAEHGGMWLDATFLCTSSEIERYFTYPIWSIKRPDYLHLSVASGCFANYALACDYNHRWVFVTIRDFLLHYWETNDGLIDYLTLDYLIVLVQEKNERIKQLFDAISPNNPRCDDLFVVLGEKFSKKYWNKLKKDTCLFKLSWKIDFPREQKGYQTFYGRLLAGELL